jgi:hypothetical protein
MLCSIQGCGRSRQYASGWCCMHYMRWKRHGVLDTPRGVSLCKMTDCERDATAGKGLCRLHYGRLRRHGDPEVRLVLRGEGLEARFWAKVDREGSLPDIGPCWPWTGYRRRTGYGIIQADNHGGTLQAHRVAYELCVEAIPEGMEIDHVCHNRSCVNPQHLRVVSHLGNMATASNPKRLKSLCPRGHPYDQVRLTGARRCTQCDREKRSGSA